MAGAKPVAGLGGRDLPASLEPYLVFRLGRTARALRERSERALRAQSIRLVDLALLTTVHQVGPMCQTAIGERIGVDRTTVTVLVDELEAEFLVARNKSRRDGRRKLVTLTDFGRGAQERPIHALADVEARFLARLTHEQRRELARTLRRLDPLRRARY